MNRIVMIAAAAAAVIAAPVQAHWQYTRWGMSPADVREANPRLRSGDDPGNSIDGSLVRLAGPHAERGRGYTVRFGFDGGERLNTVYLQADNARDCPAIAAELDAAHGRGRIDRPREFVEIHSWHDSAGNFVQLFVLGRPGEPIDCQLRYHPAR